MRTALSAILALCPALALAAPNTLVHQGRILDGQGAPINGPQELTVSLWTQQSGGTPLHSETMTVSVEHGYYTMELGDFAPTTFAGDSVWLQLDGDALGGATSRVQLHSVPFALTAEQATHVQGGVVNASELQVNGTPLVSLSSLSCGATEVPQFNGSWGCASLAHTHDAGDVVSGTFPLARLPVGTTDTSVARGDHGHSAPSWTDIQDRPTGLDDGDQDTTYSAGTGLTLDGATFNVTDSYVKTNGDTMNAEYPTLTLDHPDSGGESGIRFGSRLNAGSDGGYILFQDHSELAAGTGPENSRLSIGVHNDFQQTSTHSDELWLQGGGRLVSNVGLPDAEISALIPTSNSNPNTVTHEWRANNTVIMTLDAAGALLPVGGLSCPTGMTSVAGGRLCVDNAMSSPLTMDAAIVDCRTRQARVCKHSDMQQACGVSGFNPYTGSVTGWYGDHGRVEPDGNSDDEYLTWNRDVCTTNGNNDGPAMISSTVMPYRCCL